MNDIVLNKFRRLLAVAGSPEAAAELMYPTTSAGKDEKAWKNIVKEMDFGSRVEAKAVFLTRCAESAKEALAQDEKRTTALEELLQYADYVAKEIFRWKHALKSDKRAARHSVLFSGDNLRDRVEAVRELDHLSRNPKEEGKS